MTKKKITFTLRCINATKNNFFSDPKQKINFNLRLTMVSTTPWVQVPTFLDLSYSPRSFSVKIDPTALPIGVHRAA